VVLTEARIEEIVGGKRIDVRSAIPNGWMNQQKTRKRPILKKIFRSGKRE
jgi:hypothetical protein